MTISALIFDCDGTLVDSEPIWLRTMQDAVAALDDGPPVALRFSDIEGQSMLRSLEIVEALRGRPLPEDFLPQVRGLMARRFETDLREIPGALAMLRGLRLPVCVASNGPRDKIDLVLRLTGLSPWFPPARVFSAVESGCYKPDPALFLEAAQALGVAPAHCAVVEDSISGIEAGLRAGMTVYAYRPHAPLPPEYAGRVRPLAQLTDLCGEPWNVRPVIEPGVK